MEDESWRRVTSEPHQLWLFIIRQKTRCVQLTIRNAIQKAGIAMFFRSSFGAKGVMLNGGDFLEVRRPLAPMLRKPTATRGILGHAQFKKERRGRSFLMHGVGVRDACDLPAVAANDLVHAPVGGEVPDNECVRRVEGDLDHGNVGDRLPLGAGEERRYERRRPGGNDCWVRDHQVDPPLAKI